MKASFLVASAAAASALLLWSAPAAAADFPNGFGDKSELIITADRLIPVFSYNYASLTRTEGNLDLTTSQSGTGISLLWGRNFGLVEAGLPINVHTIPRVAFDFTIIPRLTLGAGVAFGFGLGGTTKNEVNQGGAVVTRSSNAPRMTAIGLAPRVGYVISISDIFAFWPRAGFGFYSVSAKSDIVDNNGNVQRTVSTTDTLFSLDLDPQFALVPLEHFFFHFGPLINIPLGGSRSSETVNGATTTKVSNDISLFHFGIQAGLGGWFNL